MTQPKYAPIALEDEVRQADRLEVAQPWVPHRPGDFSPARHRLPAGTGIPGPDQGYALSLADRIAPRLVLEKSEHAADVLAGAVAIGLRRAALFGRAPVSTDIELALELYGFLGDAPPEQVILRRETFAGVAHDYPRLRAIPGLVPETTLRLTPAVVRAGRAAWRELLTS
jgi:hypothetical protein